MKLIRGELPIEGGQDYHYRHFGYQSPTEPVGLARLVFRYGPVDVEHGEQQSTILRYRDGALIEIQRDTRTETAALKLIKTRRLRARPETPPSCAGAPCAGLPTRGRRRIRLVRCALSRTARPERAGLIIEIAPDFPVRLLHGAGDVDASIKESSGVDWLELDLGVVIDGETIDLVPPIVALISAESFDISAFEN